MDKGSDLIEVIEHQYNHLSKSQKLIADYIIANYDKAAYMTASKIGDIVGISESTVVRFANTLGYDGYTALQSELQELIKSKLTTVQRLSMSEEDYSNKDIGVKKILKTDMDNIKETAEDIDCETFEEVVDSVLGAKRVYILGLRSSNVLAAYLGFYLGLILDDVTVVSLGISDIFEQLIRVRKGDLVIGISYPRYSRRTLDALTYVKEQGCEVIGITDSHTSPIANIADHVLFARSNMVSFVDSLVAPMSLLNALIVSIGMRLKNEATEYFEELEHIWEEYNIYDRRV